MSAPVSGLRTRLHDDGDRVTTSTALRNYAPRRRAVDVNAAEKFPRRRLRAPSLSRQTRLIAGRFSII
jgi:hypothetical protein